MQTSENNSTSFFHYSHLTEQETNDPMLAINRFCDLFTTTAARQILWQWLCETLAAEDTQYEDSQNRADLLLLYNELLRLLDANYILSAAQIHNHHSTIQSAPLAVVGI